jgi:anti-sigma-K factor RskA
MNEHQKYEEALPIYAAGSLNTVERSEFEAHLAGCEACRAELSFWQETAGVIIASDSAVVPSTSVMPRVMHEIHSQTSLVAELRRTWAILRFQLPVVRRDLWPASAAVIIIGIAVAIVSDRLQVFYMIAPMVAAAMLAAIYGPENDEAGELTNSTQTSQWKILLARLALVFSYNLVLGLIGTLCLSLFTDVNLFWPILITWLAPMAFLSMSALVLSMWLGTGKAIGIVYALWFLQYLPLSVFRVWGHAFVSERIHESILAFWQNPTLLLGLTGLLLLIALFTCTQQGFRSHRYTA